MRPGLLDLLVCPDCGRGGLEPRALAGDLFCTGCRQAFPVRDGIPCLLPAALREATAGEDQAQADTLREMRLRDAECELYDRLYPDHKYAAELDTYARLCTPGADQLVLDLGCGTGRVTRHLMKTGAKVVGVDLSLASLRVFARRLSAEEHRRIDLIQADATRLPLRAGIFDWAVSLGLFGHLPGAEARDRGLAEIMRVTGDRARVVISLYNHGLLKRLLGRLDLAGGSRKEGRKAPSEGGIYYHNHTPAEARAWLGHSLEIHDLVGLDNHVPVLHRLPGGINADLDRLISRAGLSLPVFARELVVLGTKR